MAAGLQDDGLKAYHTQFRYLLRAFTHDHETLEDFSVLGSIFVLSQLLYFPLGRPHTSVSHKDCDD